MAFDIGTHVGRYVILRPLGRGASGLVFVAFDPQLDREVALKLIRPRGRHGDPTAQQRLVEEAQALARLSHPHVVDVYDVGTWQDRVYIALEYVEGETLASWAKREPRSVADIVGVFSQAADGLAAAHAAGIVHLDFKPSNAVVDSTGTVRVLDFGLSRRRRPRPDPSHRPGWEQSVEDSTEYESRSTDLPSPRLVGTPGYIAPELYVGAEPTSAADQFSVCVSLWELLHGERPFTGDGHEAIRDAVLEGTPNAPSRRVPRGLDAVVRRGLRLDPQARHASMEALGAQLRRTSERRSAWVLLAVAAPVVAIGAYAYARRGDDDATDCAAGRDRFQETWSDAARTQLRRGFERSGEEYAQPTFELVASALDRFGDDWVRGYSEACTATRVLREQSEQLLELRMQCLEDRRRAAGALVELFVDADPIAIEQAPRTLAGLPSVDGCSDRQALMRRVGAAPAGGSRRFDAMVRQLAAAEVGAPTAELQEALERAQAVLDEAQRLGTREHQARAHLVLARLQWRNGETELAIEHAEDGLFMADAAAADGVRADAALSLMQFHGGPNSDPQRAAWYSMMAKSVMTRLVEPRSRHSTWVEYEAALATGAGHHDVAISMLEDLLQHSPEPGSYAESSRRKLLAHAYAQAGRLVLAQREYGRVLETRRALLGEFHPYVGEVMFDLAMVRHRQGDSEAVVGQMREAVGLIERARGPVENPHPAIYRDFAAVLRAAGRDTEAAEYERKAQPDAR